MKKTLLFVLVAVVATVFTLPIASVAYADEGNTYPSKSAYLIDFDTGTVLLDKNSDEKHPIASMVKIMTLLLTFEEIDKGNLSMDEKLVVSDTAAGMGGSQMFLDAGAEYPVSDLIKGVTVCSANDAAVALGERISGDITRFVDRMNEYAKEIGMKNTLFCNATGLPNSGEQYSTAKDVSIMFSKLLRKEKYFDYSKIWMENYEHPDGRVTEMVNTNKLIRFYKNCDAGKTGFTNDAMFCLAASAKKGDMRVVGTVLGSETSKDRFREMTDMFNYAFAKYEIKTIFTAGENIPNTLRVAKAKEDKVELFAASDLKYFAEKGKGSAYTVKVEFFDNLTAPLYKGDVVGKAVLLDEKGQNAACCNIVCGKDVAKRGYGDALDDVLDQWIR